MSEVKETVACARLDGGVFVTAHALINDDGIEEVATTAVFVHHKLVPTFLEELRRVLTPEERMQLGKELSE